MPGIVPHNLSTGTMTPHVQQACRHIVLLLGIFMCGCATGMPAARPLYETSTTVVRLESNERTKVAERASHSHPITLSEDQLTILFTSISGRQKVGLLRSFLGTPGTPRVFEAEEIELLAPALKAALGQARPDEVITFVHERPGRAGRSTITSGVLFAQDEILYITIVNFWHPVTREPADLGATDRLDDVRETTNFVRSHPWISVGEQDFAIFLDDPASQTQTRRGELFGYPERTLGIAYRSFLASNPDRTKRREEVARSAQQEAFGKDAAKVIADFQQRIAELEHSKGFTQSTPRHNQGPSSGILPISAESEQEAPRETDRKLLDVIQRLEQRVEALEKELRRSHPSP